MRAAIRSKLAGFQNPGRALDSVWSRCTRKRRCREFEEVDRLELNRRCNTAASESAPPPESNATCLLPKGDCGGVTRIRPSESARGSPKGELRDTTIRGLHPLPAP